MTCAHEGWKLEVATENSYSADEKWNDNKSKGYEVNYWVIRNSCGRIPCQAKINIQYEQISCVWDS